MLGAPRIKIEGCHKCPSCTVQLSFGNKWLAAVTLSYHILPCWLLGIPVGLIFFIQQTMQNLSRETKEFHNQLCAHTGALLCGGKNQAPGGERLRSLDMLCFVSLHTNATLTFGCFWTYNLLICPFVLVFWRGSGTMAGHQVRPIFLSKTTPLPRECRVPKNWIINHWKLDLTRHLECITLLFPFGRDHVPCFPLAKSL